MFQNTKNSNGMEPKKPISQIAKMYIEIDFGTEETKITSPFI
jgi:hypothetical protein